MTTKVFFDSAALLKSDDPDSSFAFLANDEVSIEKQFTGDIEQRREIIFRFTESVEKIAAISLPIGLILSSFEGESGYDYNLFKLDVELRFNLLKADLTTGPFAIGSLTYTNSHWAFQDTAHGTLYQDTSNFDPLGGNGAVLLLLNPAILSAASADETGSVQDSELSGGYGASGRKIVRTFLDTSPPEDIKQNGPYTGLHLFWTGGGGRQHAVVDGLLPQSASTLYDTVTPILEFRDSALSASLKSRQAYALTPAFFGVD